MSWNYDSSGWPLSVEKCRFVIFTLIDLYPNIIRRDFSPGTRGLESLEAAVISKAFHEKLIDACEMEILYEFIETGRILA